MVIFLALKSEYISQLQKITKSYVKGLVGTLKLGYKMSDYSGEGINAIWVTIISHKMLEMGETGVSIISQSLRLV